MIDGVFIELMPETGWRWMLGLAAIPGAVMFYGFWYHLPESPRWLAMKGQTDTALAVLKSLRESDQDALDELAEILQSVASHRRHSNNNDDDELNSSNNNNNADMNEHACIIAEEEEEELEAERIASEYGTVPRTLSSAAVGATATNATTTTTTTSVHGDNEDGVIPRFVHMMSDVPTRRALFLGCGLMVVQQCSGINTYVVLSDEFSKTKLHRRITPTYSNPRTLSLYLDSRSNRFVLQQCHVLRRHHL